MKSNHGKIADTLLGVSFLHSRLPQEILNQRTPREDQKDTDPCCDLEHNARELAREMMDQQQTMQVDLQSLDQQLLVLAQRFQEAVEKGYAATAFAALDGLIRGVHEIRARVPQDDLTFCSQYIEVNASYLKEWVQLCDLTRKIDLMRENVDRSRACCDSKKEEMDKRKKALWDEITRDERRDEISGNANMQNRLNALEGQAALLKGKLMGLPIVQSPNQLNEFQDAMDSMIQEMAQIDAALDEILSAMDKAEAQFTQMQNAQDRLRVKEMASMEAQKIVEQLREEDKMRQDTTGTGILE